MSNKELLRYIQLIDRRLQIIMFGDIGYPTRYGDELNKIGVELAQIRKATAEPPEEKKIINIYTSGTLLDIETALLKHCEEAIECDREFTEEESKYYIAYDAMQKLRLFVGDKEKEKEYGK